MDNNSINQVKDTRTTAWKVLIASIILQIGLGFVYAWSMFVKPLTGYGVSHGWSEVAFSTAILCLGLTAAVAGMRMAKKGPGKMAGNWIHSLCNWLRY